MVGQFERSSLCHGYLVNIKSRWKLLVIFVAHYARCYTNQYGIEWNALSVSDKILLRTALYVGSQHSIFREVVSIFHHVRSDLLN